MAYLNVTQEAPLRRVPRDRLDAVGAGFGRAFRDFARRYGRLDQVDALRAKSDAELAAMGLARERIVHHVYRDRIGF